MSGSGRGGDGLRQLLMPVTGVVVAGGLATGLVALLVRESTRGTLTLGLLGGGIALLAGVAGAAIAWLLRDRPLGAQVLIVAMTAVGAVAAGSWAAARAMYVNRSDLAALAVILVAAGSGAAVVAVLIAHRFRRESRLLLERTEQVGAEGAESPPLPEIRELAAVARSLDAATVRLAEARARERDVEASRRRLVADVSHDLRTPIAKIRALTEALEDGVVADPGEVADSLGTLRDEADRLTALVDDLFELSRAQARRSLEVETVALDDVVSDAIASVRELARRDGVPLVGSGHTGAMVRVSTRDLARVLDNLLSNAIRHTAAGQEVRVVTESTGDEALVHVEDGCGGIPEPELARLFEAGYTGDGARGQRSGLGLAIADGLIRLYDGRLEVANTDRGCRFSVHLPARPRTGEGRGGA